MLDNVVGHVAKLEAQENMSGKGHHQIEILDVESEQFGAQGGDDAVLQQFDGQHVTGGCSNFSWVVYSVAAHH